MKKRLISFLLAVSMMLSILPVGAFAADSGSATETVIKLNNPTSYGSFYAYPDTSGLTNQATEPNSYRYVSPDGWEYSYTAEGNYYGSYHENQKLLLTSSFYGRIERADGKKLDSGIEITIEEGATLTGGDIASTIYNHGTINSETPYDEYCNHSCGRER